MQGDRDVFDFAQGQKMCNPNNLYGRKHRCGRAIQCEMNGTSPVTQRIQEPLRGKSASHKIMNSLMDYLGLKQNYQNIGKMIKMRIDRLFKHLICGLAALSC